MQKWKNKKTEKNFKKQKNRIMEKGTMERLND